MGRRTATFAFLLSAPFSIAGWVRVASPHVEVFTDAGERSGRSLLARFEEIREVFQVADHGPVRVFQFSSETEFRTYGGTVAGFYHSAPERDYIALHSGPGAGRTAFHEYVHLVLSHTPAPLPKWFEEGTAEFYSTLARSGNRWLVGEPIDSHVAMLGEGVWLSAMQLETVAANSEDYREASHLGMFYAESWALVHMLNLSPAWRGGMPEFVVRLSEGRPDAFQSAFGKTMDQAVGALRAYVRSMRSVTVDGAVLKTKNPIRVEQVEPIRATLALVEFALHVDRPQRARSLMDRLSREHPDSPEVIAEAGALARAEGRNDEARRLLTRAIEQGSRDADTYFEYAMLEQEAGAKNPRVEDLLGKVIELNPEFADAQFLLGVRQTDDGRYEAAIDHLKIATRARPRRSDYWHALGYAQSKIGRVADALASARRAVATASTSGEEGMAEALIALAQERPVTAAAKRPNVITPPSWTGRKGDARVEGVLRRFDCEDGAAKMLLQSGGAEIVLNVLHPEAIEMVNTPSSGYQFSCGTQNIPMIVEYFSAGRDVTRIEFRP